MRALARRTDLIDIHVDPLAERRRRRRSLLRIGLPLGGVGLIVGFLLGIAIYAYSSNRAGVLGLSETLLHALQDRVALQVSAYLEPASQAVLLAQGMVGRGGATGRAEDAYGFATSVLAGTPQVANVLFADAAGNFMLVRRAVGGPDANTNPNPNVGATETKRVLVQPGQRTVEWVARDRAGAVLERHTDPSDTYDARTRPWFTGARAAEGVFWSNVYLFASERVPGITAAVRGPGAEPDVLGIDIRLDAFSRFLGELRIGRTGRAYLVSATGGMIAGPDPKRIVRERAGALAPATVEEVGDPWLAAGWDRYRVQGPGTRVVEVGGERLISIATPVAGAAPGWLLVIGVPEAEFSGFVTANFRRTAVLSLVVVALAAGLAVLLVRQGLRADRADRAAADRAEAVRRQGAAFAELAAAAARFDPDGTPPEGLAEALAEATGARRAGVWRLLASGQVLRCLDSFEPATSGHAAGVELSRQEVPALMEALARGEEIDAPDARRDRRTSALHRSLSATLGSRAVFAVPAVQPAPGDATPRAVGMVLLEDAGRDEAARDVARACAALLALRTPAADGTPVAVPGPAVAAPRAEPGDARGLDPALPVEAAQAAGSAAEGSPGTGTDAGMGAGRSVLVLQLPEAAVAQAGAGASEGLAHRVACAAQEIAAAHGIPYLKMLGTTVVAASGPQGGGGAPADEGASARLADAAIALREACNGLLEAEGGDPDFRLGFDAGPVQGGVVGTAPGVFNLWGEAVRDAEALALSAPTGGIQASERAYRLLRHAFLFRPRGLFHHPAAGEARSYVLAGRA